MKRKGSILAYADCYMMFGIGGLLGNSLYVRLSSMTAGYRVFAFDRPRCNIADVREVGPLMQYVKPTIVFNCAGISDLDVCEVATEAAAAANAGGPRVLAAEARKIGAKIVHFSSPYVFDGKRSIPYSEKCAVNPINSQGRSRWQGELAVASENPDHLIIRPGWLFGEDGECHVTNWLKKADLHQEVPVWDETGSPTYVMDLVSATLDLVNRKERGVFHIANSNGASWQTFAREALMLAGLEDTTKVVPTQSLRMNIPANVTLSHTKYTQKTGAKIRDWHVALRECLTNLKRLRAR